MTQPTAVHFPPTPAAGATPEAVLLFLGPRRHLEVTTATDPIRGDHVQLQVLLGSLPGGMRLHLPKDTARRLAAALLAFAPTDDLATPT